MNNKIIDTEKKGVGEYLKMLGINFSVAFTVFMLFSMVFGMIFAGEEARAGIMYCWGIAGAMFAAVIMQLVFFTPLVIRRFGYGARIALFGVCLYAVLTPAAAFFGWFPADHTRRVDYLDRHLRRDPGIHDRAVHAHLPTRDQGAQREAREVQVRPLGPATRLRQTGLLGDGAGDDIAALDVWTKNPTPARANAVPRPV